MFPRILQQLAIATATTAACGQGFPSPDPVHLDDTTRWGSVQSIVEPAYPAEAIARKVKGYVDVEGAISAYGTILEPRFLPESADAGLFTAALAEVVPYWSFHTPLGADCMPSPVPVTTRVWFELEDGKPKISVSRRSDPWKASPEMLAYRDAVKRVNPRYPHGAMRVGARGANVYAAFRVDAEGRVTDVKSVAFPKTKVSKDFERETDLALAKWRFAATPETTGRLHCMSVDFRLAG